MFSIPLVELNELILSRVVPLSLVGDCRICCASVFDFGDKLALKTKHDYESPEALLHFAHFLLHDAESGGGVGETITTVAVRRL